MKMIPDVVSVVGLMFLSKHISVKMYDSYGVSVKSPQRNVFLLQKIVGSLFALVYAHNIIPLLYSVEIFSKSHTTVIKIKQSYARCWSTVWSTFGQLSYNKL